MASYEAEPVVLAEDSESADVTADLVDVGEGTKESDYAGKDVKGKIVLTAAQPGAVQDLAVGKFGAAGIVSYAQNQKTAWWGEDENLIRWGHLETFSPNKTFGFMVSLKTGRALRERLAKGEHIQLHATVKAGQHPGFTEVVTATIPGADPKLKDEEIAFSCHLDHQRPGANDNASGCVTILEVARTLQKLIDEGKLARPARTIRFIWPPEIEGTLTLLNAKPEFAQRIKAVVHMDMVGGGPVTKAVFHVTRGPMSLPSFVHDVGVGFRRIRQRAIVQLRGWASGGISVRRAGRRQGAAARAGHRVHDGQRSRRVSGQLVQNPGDLFERLARPLHPHQFRHRRQHRSHQTQARRLHRRRLRIFSGAAERPRTRRAYSFCSRWARCAMRRKCGSSACSWISATAVSSPGSRSTNGGRWLTRSSRSPLSKKRFARCMRPRSEKSS